MEFASLLSTYQRDCNNHIGHTRSKHFCHSRQIYSEIERPWTGRKINRQYKNERSIQIHFTERCLFRRSKANKTFVTSIIFLFSYSIVIPLILPYDFFFHLHRANFNHFELYCDKVKKILNYICKTIKSVGIPKSHILIKNWLAVPKFHHW